MPPQTTIPPLRTAASARGTSAPTGAKMIAASSGSGGVSSEPPAQTRAESARELLRRAVARAREGEDARGPAIATCARICAAAPKP